MDKRSTLALVLCFFIFVGWMFIQNKFFPPPKPQPKPPVAATDPKAAPKPETKPAEPSAMQVPAGAVASYPEKPPITLSSKFLDVVLTNKGAGVQGITLHYPKETDAVPILQPMDPRWPHLAVRQVDGQDEIEKLPWEIVEQTADKAVFRYRLRNGVEITKEIALEANRHTLQMTLRLDNKNPKTEGKDEPAPQKVRLEVLAFNGLDPDSWYRYEQYLTGAWRYDKSFHLRSMAEVQKGEGKLAEAMKLPAGESREKDIQDIRKEYLDVPGGLKEWFGLRNRFFTTLMLPDAESSYKMDRYSFRNLAADVTRAYWTSRNLSPGELKIAEKSHNLAASVLTNELSISTRTILQFSVYAGPLEKETLKEMPGAEDLGGYTGGCSPLSFVIKPAAAVILELLHFMQKILHNMGFAIIFTTLMIRLCLFPLSLKSQRSALQMQALAPKMQALKERYKDDQQKYSVEQMRLFKENNYNPAAGCLPLFVQMPIFIGMYSVFEMSIMLRRAPFLGWIRDLSEPDRLLGGAWGVHIPMPIVPDIHVDALNLLPIVMTITWFLQAYWTPRSPDPQMAQQQKMMMWMPIVFGLSCYGLASGLSLYFLSNSLLSMAEQKIIKKYILKVGPDGKPLTPAAPKSEERK